jgi:hypothetical protein
MSEQIEIYHNLLNSKDILPEGYLARNHTAYPLVCYVNIIIGLYHSRNYNPIPLFIKRAYEHIMMRKEISKDESYTKYIMEYLSVMANYMVTLEIEEMNKDLIPKELL